MPHEEAAMTYVCMNDFRDAADLTLVIREESVTDVSARERLLDVAFGPSRFAKTCERLREGRAPAQGLALVAHVGDDLVGTIRFWNIQAGPGHAALLLGPLAVDARHRSLGIGRKLIAEGLFRAVQRSHKAVILVGDAAYYNPLGFSRALSMRRASSDSNLIQVRLRVPRALSWRPAPARRAPQPICKRRFCAKPLDSFTLALL